MACRPKNSNCTVINSNLTLNIKLCKRRLSFILTSLQLETLGAYKIVISRSKSLKLNSLHRKLYVDFKNGLNLENPITSKSVNHFTKLCKPRLSYFYQITHSSWKLSEHTKVLFLDTSLKLRSLNRKL